MFDKDVVTGGRKMGRYGETNGISMSAPHPYTSVELNSTAVAEAGREHNNAMFKYGTYTRGEAIRFRTENPGGAHAFGSPGLDMPRKTGLGLPWNL
jgi:hypothetical protein